MNSDERKPLKVFQVEDGETYYIAASTLNDAYMYWRENCNSEDDVDCLAIDEMSSSATSTIKVGDDDTGESKSLAEWLQTVTETALLGSSVY